MVGSAAMVRRGHLRLVHGGSTAARGPGSTCEADADPEDRLVGLDDREVLLWAAALLREAAEQCAARGRLLLGDRHRARAADLTVRALLLPAPVARGVDPDREERTAAAVPPSAT